MRIDRNAAAVVGDGEPAVRLQRHLDEGGVAGDRLVHGVVEHLGEEVVQGGFVGAADIHARPPAHGLQPLQHLDGGRVIFRRAADFAGCRSGGGRLARRAAEEIIGFGHGRILA